MKKFFKILMKSVLWSVAVVALIAGILIIRAYIQSQNDFWTDNNLSDKVSVRWYYRKHEYRLYNYEEKNIVTKSLDRVVRPTEDDSLTVFFRQGLRGYLNANTGRVVIPEQYHRAWVFSEGLAAVVDKSGMVGFINKNNEVVLPFEFTYNSKKPVDYLFHDGLCTMVDEQGMCGLIDTDGRWVINPVYDYIWAPQLGGYRIAKQDGKFGLLDENLNQLLPMMYDHIEFAGQESDGVFLVKDGVKQQVGFDGTVIQPFVVDGVGHLYCLQRIDPIVVSDDYDNSLKTEIMTLSGYMLYWVGDHCGVIHGKTGKVIIPAVYDDVDMASPTLFEAELSGVRHSHILFDINGNRID